jgi:osmotically inducible protein OsmC
MPQRKADAIWKGDLKGGKGTMKFGSGAFEGSYSFASRFEEGTGTNPEELIGAAHAGCYSMALSGDLSKAGFTPESVETNANVTLEMVEGAPTISKIKLTVKANIPDIDDDKFQEIANGAKKNCPVSRVLAGADISLDATLS